MRNNLILTFVVMFFLGIAVPDARSALINVTLQPDDGKDAWIQSSPEGQFENYGDAPKLITGSYPYTNAGLIEFDLSVFQGNFIQSALLSLYLTGESGGGEVGVYQVLESWDEGTVKWVNQPDVNLVAAELKTFLREDGNRFIAFDITSLVTAWVSGQETNYGMYVGLFDTNDNPITPSAHMYSSDFKDMDYDPKLDIVMAPVPSPGAGLLLGSGLFFLVWSRARKWS